MPTVAASPTGLTADAPQSPTSARWVMASLSLSMLMASLDTSIANAGLPTLARALAATFQQVQWCVLAYLLAITALIVGAGRLGDVAGRRRMFLLGITVFTSASAICGLAPSLGFLVAARAAQGVGAAIMMALAATFIGDTVPTSSTGRAMGTLGMMSAIGTTLGPSLGGLLTAGFGWRSMFLVNVPVGMLNLYLAHRFLPPDHPGTEAGRARFDWSGTLWLALTISAYALAMTLGRDPFGPLHIALLLAALAGACAFVATERRSTSPLIYPKMFKDPLLTAGLAMSTLVSTVMMATLVVGPFYLARAIGLRETLLGLALSVGPMIAALNGVPAGRVVDRFGPGRVTLLGLVGMATGCVLLTVIPAAAGVMGYLLPIAMITASYALFQAANNTAVMTHAQPHQRGIVSGMLSLSRNIGLVTGASVMGAVFSHFTGPADVNDAVPAAVTRGMHSTFVAASVLILAAIAIGTRTQAQNRARPAS